MYKIRTFNILKTGLLLLVYTSCSEEIGFKADSFESALVVEATITNELKNQEVILSKTFMFEEDGPKPETNAAVKIISDSGEYLFSEKENGKYVSEDKFKAQPSLNYTLKITTSTGKKYSSSPSILPQNTQIEQLYAVRETDDEGVNGMSIFIDSYDASGNSKYYRYTYEESYKIIAPKWVPEDIIVVDPTWPLCHLILIPKEEEKRICYNVVNSQNIIQTNTTTLTEDRLSRFLVRHISSEDHIISWRYSILVTQYIQSQEAYSYYETLNNFTEEGSIFSQIQTGFFNGNVFSENNPEEKIVGYFDVSTVSSKRIYFNYEDFYPGEERPSYARPCFEYTPVRNQGHPTDACGPLINGVLSNEIVYFKVNESVPESSLVGPYIMVPRACGDCTELGNNVAPDFWEE